ncbi:hypothetical protein GCM10023191_043800 [Actinoallomurus oryzae]|uniref:Uncharacterized protein n=1 Tax=Actinoallomurus oryzae TaxID=502180 RepID=A0ABP8QA45_9ACTN
MLLAVGPVAVAASMFPAAIRRASARPAQEPALEPALGSTATPGDDGPAMAGARLLHRVCHVYAVAGVAVPVFGFATAGAMHVTGDAWVIVSIVLTALAAAFAQNAVPCRPSLARATTRRPSRQPSGESSDMGDRRTRMADTNDTRLWCCTDHGNGATEWMSCPQPATARPSGRGRQPLRRFRRAGSGET